MALLKDSIRFSFKSSVWVIFRTSVCMGCYELQNAWYWLLVLNEITSYCTQWYNLIACIVIETHLFYVVLQTNGTSSGRGWIIERNTGLVPCKRSEADELSQRENWVISFRCSLVILDSPVIILDKLALSSGASNFSFLPLRIVKLFSSQEMPIWLLTVLPNLGCQLWLIVFGWRSIPLAWLLLC